MSAKALRKREVVNILSGNRHGCRECRSCRSNYLLGDIELRRPWQLSVLGSYDRVDVRGYMKKLSALICLILWMPLGHANECVDRILRLANPIFPASLNAVHVIDKERVCTVDVAYSINGDGKAENINSFAEKEICTAFKITAMRTLRNSVFTPGPYLNLCYTRIIFKLEDGQMKWEFSDVPAYIR
jgi:hypothetical protein